MDLDLADLGAYLSGLGKAAESVDFTQPLTQIVSIINTETRSNFDGQHAPDGTPWAPLKTPQFRTLPFSGRKVQRPILVKTAALMLGATGGKGYHATITPRGLEISIGVPYGIFHQLGTRHMVARPFAGLNDSIMNQATALLGEWYAKAILARASSAVRPASKFILRVNTWGKR